MKIKGKVIDKSNSETMFGVNVYLSDKNGIVSSSPNNGVATDPDGRYVLNNIKKGDYITISYIGYKSQTIKIDPPSASTVSMNFNFYLVPDATNIEEFTVVAEKDKPVEIVAKKDKNYTPYIVGGIAVLTIIGGYITYKKLKN